MQYYSSVSTYTHFHIHYTFHAHTFLFFSSQKNSEKVSNVRAGIISSPAARDRVRHRTFVEPNPNRTQKSLILSNRTELRTVWCGICRTRTELRTQNIIKILCCNDEPNPNRTQNSLLLSNRTELRTVECEICRTRTELRTQNIVEPDLYILNSGANGFALSVYSVATKA